MRLSRSSREYCSQTQITQGLSCYAISCLILLSREFQYNKDDDTLLVKELVLQVRKVIGPFAAPKKIYLVGDLPKTRSGKVRPHAVHESI